MLDVQVSFKTEKGKSTLRLFCPEANEALLLKFEGEVPQEHALKTYWRQKKKFEKVFLKAIEQKRKWDAKARAEIRKKISDEKRKNKKEEADQRDTNDAKTIAKI